MIAIHSPEFDFEKSRAQVEKVAQKYHKNSPIMMDNDFAYWRALGNRYWPAFYLFDQEGELVDAQAGELHQGQAPADEMENHIRRLLGKEGGR